MEGFFEEIEDGLAIPEGSYVSIDGKSLRGNGTEKNAPLQLLHAYSHELGIVLGQIECKQEKINEITACPKLLDMLKIRGR